MTRELRSPSPFVAECRRLMNARCAATSASEREDAEWALTYAMQMHRAGRFDEYLALRAEQEARP
jgi:hypothetical protein